MPAKPGKVVLVHGAGENATMWRHQAEALAGAGFEPTAVDLPGHGESEGEPSTTISGYAAWLAAYLSTFEAPVHLVGHSMGGLIALQTAVNEPGRVRSIVMVGVADTMRVNPKLLDGSRAGDAATIETMSRWMHAREPVGIPAWTVADTAAMLKRAAPGVLHNDLVACDTYGGAAAVAAQLGPPMLLILGDRDVMTRPEDAAPIAQASARATTVVIPGAGHMSMVERPDAVNGALLGFLEMVDGQD